MYHCSYFYIQYNADCIARDFDIGNFGRFEGLCFLEDTFLIG